MNPTIKANLSKLDIEQLVQLREVMLTRNKWAKADGISMYRPHPKQDKFHRLGHFKYRYLRTGNRFGKSDCGSAEDVAWALGERPWYSEDDPARYAGIPQCSTKGIILCTDWEKAKSVFTSEVRGTGQGKLWKWIPEKARLGRDVNHSGHIHRIKVKSKWGGESLIEIDTIAAFKLNAQRGESDFYDWIHVDEPIPKDMWDAYARGLMDRNGSAWFTCTPLREPWINDFFIPNRRAVLDPLEPNVFADPDGVRDRVVIVGTSADNPHNSVEGMRSYMTGLSDRDKAARMFGKPIDQSGVVHPWFTDDHVYTEPPPGWSAMNKPPLDYTVRYHVDWHAVTPIAVIFCATAPHGTTYFFDEIFEHASSKEIADQIKAKIDGYFVPDALADPSAFIEWKVNVSTFASDLEDEGLILEKASKDLARGIILTNDALKVPGRLMFSNTMYRTLWEFDHYVFQDPNKKPDKPVDKNDHMMEGVHRLVITGLPYIAPEIYEMGAIRESANYLLSL